MNFLVLPRFNLSRLKLTFRSLQYRNYRLFFAGQSISLIGTWIQRIAMPWLVYHLTGSALLLGVVGFASQIPTFLLSPVAGVYSDRLNRYRILIVTQVLSMIQALMLAILFFTDVIQVWHIVLLGIFLGCINAFDVPARQSFVIQMVDRKEDLGNAIALNSTMVNGARLLGPSIAGVLIASIGEGYCFLINGISYLFVLYSLFSMKVPKQKINKAGKKVWKEFRDGFNYTFGYLPFRYVILLLGLLSLVGMPYTVLMPVFAKEIFHGGAHTFGFLMSASGLGALSGAIYLASRKSVAGLTRLIPAASMTFGVGLVLFSFSRTYSLSLVLMVLTGLGMMLQMAAGNTLVQTLVEDDKRGRVMSFYAMAFVGIAPFGSLLAGSLADLVGAPYTLMIGGLLCMAGAGIFIGRMGELEKRIAPVLQVHGNGLLASAKQE